MQILRKIPKPIHPQYCKNACILHYMHLSWIFCKILNLSWYLHRSILPQFFHRYHTMHSLWPNSNQVFLSLGKCNLYHEHIYWWPISTHYLCIKAALLALYRLAKLFSSILFSMCTLYMDFQKNIPKQFTGQSVGNLELVSVETMRNN